MTIEMLCIDQPIPPRRPIARVLGVSAFLASVLIHTCVIAGGVLLFRTAPPSALLMGESMEVSLLALHGSASGSRSSGLKSGPETQTPPAAMPEKTDGEKNVATKPPSSAHNDVASTNAPPRKNGRTSRPAPSPTATPPPKGAQSAGNGQNASDEGRHGYGGTENGSLPIPFGARINPRPAYPEIARQRGQEGQVVVLVNVDAHGNPVEVLLEASSSYALLDQEALRTIRGWKFNPASHNGAAVSGTVRVPVTFRLQ